MEESALKGSKVCLVLTCRKPEYEARLQKSLVTHQALKEAGFTIIYLYGDSTLSEPVLLLNPNTGFYNLDVPTEDTYYNLVGKIFYAYKYLDSMGVSGILKMDDDTAILEPDIVLDPRNYLVDYMGSDFSLYDKGSVIFFEHSSFKERYPITIEHPIKYFPGPFYWISAKALAHIVSYGLHYPWEDVAVGDALRTFNCKIKETKWFNRDVVKWY